MCEWWLLIWVLTAKFFPSFHPCVPPPNLSVRRCARLHRPTFAPRLWLNVQLLFSHRRMSFYCRCEKRCSPARQAVITCRCHPEDDDHISNEDMADRRSSSRLPEAHYSMLGALCCVIRGLPASQSPSFGCRRWAACELWSSLAARKVSGGSIESSLELENPSRC